ncbi:MAG: PAS domain S-box protein [Gammaproteobacteria bacterium]|jgi:PAS domain S-box-containing protein
MRAEHYNRLIVDSLPCGVAVSTLSGTIVDMNNSFEELTGFSIENDHQLNFLDISSRYSRTTFDRHLDILFKNGNLGVMDDQLANKNGARVDVRISATLLKDKKNSIICWIVENYSDQDGNSLTADQSYATDYDVLLSSAQAKSILKTAADAIITITTSGTIHSFNPAAEKMFGYSTIEVLGKNISMLMPEPHCHQHAKYISNYLSTGNARIIGIGRQAVAQRKDKSIFPIHLAISEINFEHETLFTGIVTDISDVKEAQQLLEVSEERFRRSQRSANIGTWDWDIKTGDLYWSDQISALFGYKEGELQTTYENFLAAVHPDDRQYVIDAVDNCIYRGDIYDIEHRCIWPDGTIKWLSERGDVTRDANGEPSHMLGVVQDITLRKNAEQALLESEERFRGAFETAAHGMALVSLSGHWLKVNRSLCEITGYTEQELLSTNFQSITHPDDLEGNLLQFKKLLNSSLDSYQLEKRYICKTGSIKWVLVSESLIRDAEGKPLHLISQLIDITARKKAEEDLQKAKEVAENANQAKSEFLSSMSHELRTPLNAIIGFSELLETGKGLDSRQSQDVQEIKNASYHLLKLINDVLDLAKIESRAVSLSMESVNLTECLAQCCKLIEQQAGFRQITIHNKCRNNNSTLFVNADTVRVKQVLTNLLSNAVKYNREQGKITIYCQSSGDGFLRVNISDTGIGIADDRKPGLFEAFDRLGAEYSEIEGTGIGLVITKRLVEKMGGRIGYYTTAGKGSTFWVEFEKIEQAPDTVVEDYLNLNNHVPGQYNLDIDTRLNTSVTLNTYEQRILVVEDNPTNQTLIGSQLKKLGYHYNLAATGNEGLALWKNNSYSLVLMDINLPDISGVELTQKIRNMERNRQVRDFIPIIAITALALNGDRERFLQSGLNDYIAKPIELFKLDYIIKKWTVPGNIDSSTTLDTGNCSDNPVIDASTLSRYVGEEPDVQETVLRSFLVHTPDILNSIHQACEDRNAENILAACHKLKSSAQTIGAKTLADTLVELETATRDTQWKNIFVFKNLLQKRFDQLNLPEKLDKLTNQIRFGEPKVLIIDDDPFILDHSVCVMKRMGLNNLETANSGNMALEKIATLGAENIELIICDLNMPQMHGIEFLNRLSELRFKGKIIIVSGVINDAVNAAKHFAESHQLTIKGTLEKPLTADALNALL